jgi:NAD-dependent SIR2 family protein deacetylase
MVTAKVLKNIVVLAGAGISTKAGIRDFRTPGEWHKDFVRTF